MQKKKFFLFIFIIILFNIYFIYNNDSFASSRYYGMQNYVGITDSGEQLAFAVASSCGASVEYLSQPAANILTRYTPSVYKHNRQQTLDKKTKQYLDYIMNSYNYY